MLNGISGGGVKLKMKNFNRNIKAISPIFATLILIAIAVIAGVVVYVFTSGTLATMTGGGTAGQEKVSVQAASGTTAGVTLYAQSTGGVVPPVAGLNVIIKNGSGATVTTASVTPPTANSWDGGKLVTLAAPCTLVAGTYTVTLITPAGGSFVSPSFVVS
jgi:flagellin-like protein